MRLRGQILVAACGTALLFGVLGVALLYRRSQAQGAQLLDDELRLGAAALDRQWSLRQAERAGAYRAVARQPYFRAYLATGDRGQMSYFAGAARRAGAALAVIVDPRGSVLAGDGPGAEELAELARRGRLTENGSLLALRGRLYRAERLPVGGDSPAGYLIAADLVDAAVLRTDAAPFGIEVAIEADGVLVSTLPRELDGEVARVLAGAGAMVVGRRQEARRIRLGALDGARVLVAVPVSRIGPLTTDAGWMVIGLLAIIILVAGGGALFVIGRVTGPVERLRRAGVELASGNLEGGAAVFRDYRGRRDEVGDLAAAFLAAAEHLSAVANWGAALSRDLDRTLAALDVSLGSVAVSVDRQEEDVRRLAATFAPAMKMLEAFSKGLWDAELCVRQLCLAALEAERSAGLVARGVHRVTEVVAQALSAAEAHSSECVPMRTLRRIAAQLESLPRSVLHHGEQLSAIGEKIGTLLKPLREWQSYEARQKQERLVLHRVVGEIGGVTEGQVARATALRASAESLRRKVAQLNDALGAFGGRAAR